MRINPRSLAFALTGLATAALLIAVTHWVYPLHSTPNAGHLLAWAMSALVGIQIALKGAPDLESWVGTTGQEDERDSSVPFGEQVVSEEMREGCIRFGSQNPICYLSTFTEDGEWPQVRTVLLWRAQYDGFYFILFSSKPMLRQIRQNPRVQVCFHQRGNGMLQAAQMRLSGQLEIIADRDLIGQARASPAIWRTLSRGEGQGQPVVCRLARYSARFWRMQDPLEGEFVRERPTPRVNRADSRRAMADTHS